MKFRNPKTGEVFEDIEAAIRRVCFDHRCGEKTCPLDDGEHHHCADSDNPVKIAKMLGFEIVDVPRIVLAVLEHEKRDVTVKPRPVTEIEYIREQLGEDEILAQLAEEAAELAQAALKMRRAMGNKNPTPVTLQEARERVLEECADVSNCLVALGLDGPMDRLMVARIMKEKQVRCAGRIRQAKLKES